MSYRDTYDFWMTDDYFDEDTKKELAAIADDEAEIEDRFYRDLVFGTGGLRGVIGAGTNRMNFYTVRKATQGLANFIVKQNAQDKGVAIAYDSRKYSPEFAAEAALCLCANGIKSYLFESLRPTPELSYAVRKLGCTAGIVITASHNPPEYNGYKVYWEDGAQITAPKDREIIAEVKAVTDFHTVKTMDKQEALDKGLLTIIGAEIDDAYMEELKKQIIHPEIIKEQSENIKIVYTPFHGTGLVPVKRVLSELGFKNVYIVPEQELPDPEFTTLEYPNPEDPKAFELALKLAKEKNADIVLATDPDADRLGIYALDTKTGKYMPFTGNMSGLIIAEYQFRERTKCGLMPKNPAMVKTIVTTNMADPLAADYNVNLIEVLTGFKFIGEQIGFLEAKGEENRYIFGFEESYGYLAGSYVRDKDAVVASMLICEMAAFYRSQGISLVQARAKMYSDYGFYCNKLDTFTFEGETGMKKMNAIMDTLRNEKLDAVAGLKVIGKADYKLSVKTDYESGKTEELTLPKSNVITFYLEDNASVVIRPSGTEPKIKLYYTTVGTSVEDAAEKQVKLSADFTKIVG